MIKALRARQPGASLSRIAWWYSVHAVCYAWFNLCYGYRAWGLNRIPRSGPVLLLCNHQSYLDPIIVGIASHYRQFHAMARSTLFQNPAFRWLINSMNAIPVDRGVADLTAMRQSVGVLRQGHALLIFPEGTRTTNGMTQPFAKGTMLLIKRAKPVVVPVAIEGAYTVWPKHQAAPRLTGRIGIEFGCPIGAEALMAMGDEPGLEHVRRQVEDMRLGLARWRRSSTSCSSHCRGPVA